MSGGSLLRLAVLGLGGALVGGGLLLLANCGLGIFLRLAVPGLLLIAAMVGERWRYRRLQSSRPGPEWLATDERFIDPQSGKQVTVFYRKSTGERRYVSS